MIIWNESHLRKVMRGYVDYYNASRTHLSLAKDAPEGRELEPPSAGPIRDTLAVGGLHRVYHRKAA